jgi:hypothetical protein
LARLNPEAFSTIRFIFWPLPVKIKSWQYCKDEGDKILVANADVVAFIFYFLIDQFQQLQ